MRRVNYKINLNDIVRFKLSPEGEIYLKNRCHDLSVDLPVQFWLKPEKVAPLTDGWHQMQLHEFAHFFGPKLTPGSVDVVDPSIVISHEI